MVYLDIVQGYSFVLEDKEFMELLLWMYILEKVIYEVGYEMNVWLEWLWIFICGVFYVMEGYIGLDILVVDQKLIQVMNVVEVYILDLEQLQCSIFEYFY